MYKYVLKVNSRGTWTAWEFNQCANNSHISEGKTHLFFC